MNSITALQEMTAATLACGIAGVWVALLYVRATQRKMAETRAIYEELLRRVLGTPPPPSSPADDILRLSAPLSLKCRIYGSNPHAPCSGTTDDGTDSECYCWCHDRADPKPARV